MTAVLDMVGQTDSLPEGWDTLAADYYQKRAFLSHCQQYNPCRQRYYLLSAGGTLLAGAVVYSLRFDLLTYLGIKSPVTMQIVGIPCSVSSAGLIGDLSKYGELLRGILNAERGLVACLNLDGVPEGVPMAIGRTWPDMVFENSFSTWDRYMAALRSPYRRRMVQIGEEGAAFSIRTMPCSCFSDEMYSLYAEVFNRSEGKLEKLTREFFASLPKPFCLTTYSAQGAVRGWAVTLRDGDRYYFFLGGQDYTYRPKPLYLLKLMTIIRQGIVAGARLIDLGQSAEVPKMRMGAVPCGKAMLAHHHHLLPQAMLKAGIGLLSYHRHVPATHVFKVGKP